MALIVPGVRFKRVGLGIGGVLCHVQTTLFAAGRQTAQTDESCGFENSNLAACPFVLCVGTSVRQRTGGGFSSTGKVVVYI